MERQNKKIFFTARALTFLLFILLTYYIFKMKKITTLAVSNRPISISLTLLFTSSNDWTDVLQICLQTLLSDWLLNRFKFSDYPFATYRSIQAINRHLLQTTQNLQKVYHIIKSVRKRLLKQLTVESRVVIS